MSDDLHVIVPLLIMGLAVAVVFVLWVYHDE